MAEDGGSDATVAAVVEEEVAGIGSDGLDAIGDVREAVGERTGVFVLGMVDMLVKAGRGGRERGERVDESNPAFEAETAFGY